MIKNTEKSANGTSFFGDKILTTPRKLIELFPEACNKNVEKTNFNFTLENSDGEVFTIYDWKQSYPDLDENVDFHIGGHYKRITEKTKYELLLLI